MRVLVTGAAGFIGQHVLENLTRSGEVAEILALDLKAVPEAELNGVPVRSHVGDVRDPELCHSLATGMDSIVHLAAVASVPASIEDPVTTHEVNAGGTLNVLEAARVAKVEHILVASSSAVYGEQPGSKKSEGQPTDFLSPYAATKGATESYALAYQAAYGIKVAALRFFNVYGPGQRADHPYAAVIPRFLDAMLRGRPLTVFGDGEQSRDFIPVTSVADILTKVTVRQLSSRTPVNVASGRSISINALINNLADIHPTLFEVKYGEVRPGDIRHSGAEVEQLRSLVPDHKTVALVDALSETYDWYRTQVGSA